MGPLKLRLSSSLRQEKNDAGVLEIRHDMLTTGPLLCALLDELHMFDATTTVSLKRIFKDASGRTPSGQTSARSTGAGRDTGA